MALRMVEAEGEHPCAFDLEAEADGGVGEGLLQGVYGTMVVGGELPPDKGTIQDLPVPLCHGPFLPELRFPKVLAQRLLARLEKDGLELGPGGGE